MPADGERLRVELHCHTCYSADSLLRPADLLARARKLGLDRVAITDHNTIEGALHARELDPERIIIGEEILTTRGELLAYYLEEEVPAGLNPLAAIDRIRDQGGLISVSHPFDGNRSGAWHPTDLERILPLVDALEVFNARALSNRPNRRAAAAAREAGLPGTAGSDAHAALELGRIVMQLPLFEDSAGLRSALPEGSISGRLSSPLVHFFSRYAVWRKRLGWRLETT